MQEVFRGFAAQKRLLPKEECDNSERKGGFRYLRNWLDEITVSLGCP